MNDEPDVVVDEAAIEDPDLLGVIALGALNTGDLITKRGLAKLLNREPCSVDRAVKREELPLPTRLAGQDVWVVDLIREHVENRQRLAADDAGRTRQRLQAHRVKGNQ